ncbi:Auxin efflux carrier component 6 [Glycine soja]|nr:Auxin efflux carrier component 6 [Glycine soja]
MAALVPLYVPMILAYYSVRWWKIFTPEQCSGINRFVAIFAIPFLTFHFLSSNSPYTMNILFIAADTLQKVVILGALFLWTAFAKRGGGLDWTITLFSLSTLPNTLIVGVPLLTAMYGDSSASLMSQLVFMQGVLWFTLMLFLYEYQGAMHLFLNRIPDSGDSIITTFTVDPDVNTLNGNEPLLVDLEKKENGELHVMVRSSSLKIFNRSTEMCCAHLPKRRASSFSTILDLQSEGFEEMPKIHEEKMCKRDAFKYLLNSVKHESIIDTSSSPKVIEDKEVKIVHGIQYPLSKGPKEVKIEEKDAYKKQQMPRASVMVRLTLSMVWRNLVRNPNTYASFFGLVWSLISFRWNIKMPSIINGSILILSQTATGIAMFSMGLFMALQPKIIACGKTSAAMSIVARCLVGPAVIGVTSIVIGIRGVLLRVAIVQAAIPQSIVAFVFAKEYNIHADILSTA